MTAKFITFAFWLLPVFATIAFSQPPVPHVRTRYVPDAKLTVVETDPMYIANLDEQFMQFTLTARYEKQQLVKPPKKIDFSFFSHTRKPFYERFDDQRLVIFTELEVMPAASLKHWLGRGEKFKGREMFVSEKREGLGLTVEVPKFARVRQGIEITGIYMEWMLTSVKPADFKRLASASSVEFQIGKTRFKLSDNQLKTLRAFNSLITPR